jgi:hypothetical protein
MEERMEGREGRMEERERSDYSSRWPPGREGGAVTG